MAEEELEAVELWRGESAPGVRPAWTMVEEWHPTHGHVVISCSIALPWDAGHDARAWIEVGIIGWGRIQEAARAHLHEQVRAQAHVYYRAERSRWN